MSHPAIELAAVSFAYHGELVLNAVDLRVEADGYLAILGPNGGGKTTLLRLILGLLRPHSGTIRVFGDNPNRARGAIGYVPQHAGFDLQFPIRVRDVVLMGRLKRLSLLRRVSAADRIAVEDALQQVDMAALADRPIGELSGGQLQRVLIARALAVEPRLLILDEPTASLDERVGESVWELLGRLSQQMALVLVTHDIGAISRHVRSVACLNRKLYFHPSQKLTPDVIEAAYGCPVELLAHGQPHRVLARHGEPTAGEPAAGEPAAGEPC